MRKSYFTKHLIVVVPFGKSLAITD